MAIVLRSQKTSPLTFEEMDGNFTDVNGRLTTVEANHIKNVNGLTANSNNAIVLDTDDISEASGSATNIWFTNARARAAISITDSGGDGSLSYNSTTGVITYVGPSASEVRAHFTAGEGIDITDGLIAGEDASSSNKGIASFNITNFTVSSGAVTAKDITLTSDSGSATNSIGETFTISGGEGIDTSATGSTVTIAAELATDSNKGVASFSSDHFTVTSGAVVIKPAGIDDTLIDFGTGANQVNTADLPEDPSATVSSGTMYYTDARVLTKINATSIDGLSDVDTSSVAPSNNDVLTWSSADNEWVPAVAPGASGGEANTITNVGTGAEIFKTKVGVDFKLKTLIFDSNFSVAENTDDISIALTAAPDFGNIEIGGDTITNLVTNNDINIVTNGTGTINITGDLLPGTDSTYDLGAVGTEWAQAHIDTVTATNLAGTLTTAAQTNITSVGTLNGLTIAGSQTIDMGSNKITNITDPVSAQDAATKNYVDGLLSSGTTIFTLQADSGSNDTVETGDTIDFEGTANEIETTVSANKITIGLPNDVTISNNLTVDGNFTVNGTSTTINATTIDVTDPLIKLARDNESSDSVDIGFFGHYYDNGPAHAGLFRDASDNKFKMFTGYGAAGDVGSATTIDTSDAGFRLATLQLEALEIGNTDNPSLHIRGSAISTVNTNQNLTLDTAGSGVIELNSNTNVNAEMIRLSGASTEDRHIEIGSGRSGNGNSYVDLIGDTTYSDYGMRIQRYSTGANAASRVEHRGTGGLSLWATDAGYLQFGTSNTERMRIDSSGNVGIGTSSISSKLTVQGTITIGSTGHTYGAGALGYSDANWGFLYRPPVAGTQGAHLFESYSGNNLVEITEAGNVGIGTTDTNLFNGVGGVTRLAVCGSDTSTSVANNSSASISVINTDTTAGNTAAVHFARADTDDTPNYAGASIVAQFPDTQVTGQYPKGLLAFLTSTAANQAPSEKMRIDSSGNVGIGTTPSSKLHVAGGADSTIRNTASSGSSWFIGTNVSSYVLHNESNTPMVFTTNGTEKMRILANGNVGIGETNPSTALEVNGTVTATTFDGVATSAQYADLAERYLPDAEYPAGTVMTVGGGAEVTYCRQDSIPVGVISTAPAYLMNSELAGGVAVALVGRVPVRVVGSVVKGQVVYADHDGVASATAEGERVGIALETNDHTGEKLVECVLKV